jgi:hypothetical protein
MPFESLSFRHTLQITEVPHRWLPLIHLYDPDLPLFPIYYFHALRSDLAAGARPRAEDRVFGYVEHIRVRDAGGIEAGLVTNKDLALPANNAFRASAEFEVRARFGVIDPVTIADVSNSFQPPLQHANQVLAELWHRVIANAYGNLLPFGRLWDEVLGLARFVASWNAPAGRKSELIQTHYFATRFGQFIQAAAGIPQVDFHLLPTATELLDQANPLSDFSGFRDLLRVAEAFAAHYGTVRAVGSVNITAFNRPAPGRLNSQALFNIIDGGHIPNNLRPAAVECFNTFDKGPQRTVIYLLMLNDLRHGLLQPGALTPAQCGSIYDGLARSYQSPKVIEIYAQQCFGNRHAMPIDTWIDTFLKWPLLVYPTERSQTPYTDVFSHAVGLGKVERLLWVTGQARKVHSSACDDAVWCVKYGSDAGPRGANPLACNICLEAIRNHCPAYAAIRHKTVGFNGAAPAADFQVSTSIGNNVTPHQTFLTCTGRSIYAAIEDNFSPADDPSGFAPFPQPGHAAGAQFTVEEFVERY